MKCIHKTVLAGLLCCLISSAGLAAEKDVDFASVYVRPKTGANANEKMTKDIEECAADAPAGQTKSSVTTLFKYRSCLVDRGYQLTN